MLRHYMATEKFVIPIAVYTSVSYLAFAGSPITLSELFGGYRVM
jgi:hypothetical protein